MLKSMEAAIHYIFRTRRRLDLAPRGLDEYTREPSHTRSLLQRAALLTEAREYLVVTGSRGKGSVVAMTAKLLQALGHQVGMITSPHLLHWNERIRVNGSMIPDHDFLRILSELQPDIDAVTRELNEQQYLSPQGIFLGIALRYFAEKAVDVAVLEVGRGGRFDDIAVVPNRFAIFSPIMLEHRALLGKTLERIAWHKAGIISAGGSVLSARQAAEVEAVLRAEAQRRGAEIRCLGELDEAQLKAAHRGDGQLIEMQPYGELLLPLIGRYQVENASLAIRAVEMLREKTAQNAAIDDETIRAIRRGLSAVTWHGRVHKLADAPAVFVDGAITVPSAESFLASVEPQLRQPVVTIVGIPRDRDFAAVYAVMARVSQALIITETDINPNTRFPEREAALLAARALVDNAQHRDNLTQALSIARSITGEGGTILLAVSLMLVGECMLIWNIDTAKI